MILKITASLLLFSSSIFGQVSVLKPAFGTHGMVSTSDPIATAVGVHILKEGATLRLYLKTLGHRQNLLPFCL